jgi:hypothetical protein
MLIGPWLHVAPDVGVPGPRIDHLHEMTRFFDYWLKGVDDGVMAEPPITLYVQHYDPPAADRTITSGVWRCEAGWPLERSIEQSLYLTSPGALVAEPPAAMSAVTYNYNPTVGTTFGMFSASSPLVLPVDQRLEEAYSESWTSAPLTEPLEILGYARVVLNVSMTTDVATVVARLIDVAPNGTAALVTKGILNLTHRDSHETPTPLVPGQRYEVTVPLDATSWLFEPGHRIELGLSGSDFPNTWPSPEPYVGTIYLGEDVSSRLILPIIGPQEPALPTPNLHPPAPSEPTAEVQAERPIWRVSRDHMAGATEVFLRTAHRARVGEDIEFSRGSEMNAVASERDPARASVRGLSWVTLQLLDRTVDTRARGQIESTASALHVTIQLDITMDRVPYLTKRWSRSIPRHLL